MDKYHVALSFAGEDREYVERVATRLTHFGVKVFYDKFEETPEELAEKITEKLRDHGVLITVDDRFRYPPHAKADIDFPLSDHDQVTEIITALKSSNWYIQSPAIDKIFLLDWSKLSLDQIFVLGRNVYQCACGDERKAVGLLKDIRRTLAKFPQEAAEHLLNGMFYEMYFDSKGVFRGSKLKSARMSDLFSIQTVDKYEVSIYFISQALEPYRAITHQRLVSR